MQSQPAVIIRPEMVHLLIVVAVTLLSGTIVCGQYTVDSYANEPSAAPYASSSSVTTSADYEQQPSQSDNNYHYEYDGGSTLRPVELLVANAEDDHTSSAPSNGTEYKIVSPADPTVQAETYADETPYPFLQQQQQPVETDESYQPPLYSPSPTAAQLSPVDDELSSPAATSYEAFADVFDEIDDDDEDDDDGDENDIGDGNTEADIPIGSTAVDEDATAAAELPDYSVRQLNVSAAIFEHIAPVQFYTQRWKILAKVELPDFSESLLAIDRYDSLVKKVCQGFRSAMKKMKVGTASNATMAATNGTATAGKPNKNQKITNKIANSNSTIAGKTFRRKPNNGTMASATAANDQPSQPAAQPVADLRAHCRNAEREVAQLTARVRSANVELRKVTETTTKSNSRNGPKQRQHRMRRIRRDTTAADNAAARDAKERQFYVAVEETVSDRLSDRVIMLEREAKWGFGLMKNELGVLRGTNNAVYKTIWRMTQVQRENDANIKRMVARLRSMRGAVTRDENELQARLTLVELVQLISLELTGLVEQQNEVLSLVTTSAAGRLHPMVMGVAELSRIYTNMSRTMGLDDILVDGDQMPKMVSVRSTQDGRNVDVLIEVPMVKRDEFQLFRAYALPRRQPTAKRGGESRPAAVVLEDEYLAVNEADQTFVQLSEEQLRSCTSMTIGDSVEDGDERVRYVCKLTGPLYTSGADSCMISLFQQRPLGETPCEMQTVRRADSVQKMRMPSTWLWLAANATTVRVSCATRPNGDAEVLVPAQSIVQLNGMCELETHAFRLQAENTIFRNATVLQSKLMPASDGNVAAIGEFAQAQATMRPSLSSHDLDQDPIRLSQPRQYHRWLNQNGRAIQALTRSFRQVDARRKKEKQELANQAGGPPDYMQVVLTFGQVAVRLIKLIASMWSQFMGEDDDFDLF